MPVTKSSDADFRQLLDSHDKVVVKYYADWCGNCRLFSPKFKRMSDADTNQQVLFLDVNAETNPEARKLAGVSTLPFFAIFKGGELVETLSASKEEAVAELISKLN